MVARPGWWSGSILRQSELTFFEEVPTKGGKAGEAGAATGFTGFTPFFHRIGQKSQLRAAECHGHQGHSASGNGGITGIG